jgi:hypothetical protein
MKLKDEIRETINTDWSVRAKIALDFGKHEKTLQNWTQKDSEHASKLLAPALQETIKKYFPKYDNILEEE